MQKWVGTRVRYYYGELYSFSKYSQTTLIKMIILQQTGVPTTKELPVTEKHIDICAPCMPMGYALESR